MSGVPDLSRQRVANGYRAYRVTSPAHDPLIILAAGSWSAVGALLRWRKTNAVADEAFTLHPSWADSLTGIGRQHIDGACASCTETVIASAYRADRGWSLTRPTEALRE